MGLKNYGTTPEYEFYRRETIAPNDGSFDAGSKLIKSKRHPRERQSEMPLRKRKNAEHSSVKEPGQPNQSEASELQSPAKSAKSSRGLENFKPRRSFNVAKWVVLRMMGMIYTFAFASAVFQNEGLMGNDGLSPAHEYMNYLKARSQSPFSGFCKNPTVFWWIPLTYRGTIENTGLALSILVILGVNSWLLQFALWILYFSIVTVANASSFYGYGWESQILETGFLCIFLCELPAAWSLNLYERQYRPATTTILWLFQWLLFRISTGAGLIKIRGGSCWQKKTCLYYHFETQPIPSPLSFLYHFLPRVIHRRMVDTDLLVQLYTAWFVLFPAIRYPFCDRLICFIVRLGGFLQAGLMVGILLSGNFSFLNHLTIIPALACFDDSCWPRWMHPKSQTSYRAPASRRIVDVLLLCLILSLSQPVVENLLQRQGKRQLMNASFDSFRLANSYGAFGSVGTARYEAIVQISDDGVSWIELEFPCKPGNVYRRPCFCAPYHYRLDWNLFFLGFKPHQSYLRRRETWLFALIRKILESDKKERPWLDLLDRSSKDKLNSDYYSKDGAPLYAKVDMYHYRMAAPLWQIAINSQKGDPVAWWTRSFEESLIPVVTIESFR